MRRRKKAQPAKGSLRRAGAPVKSTPKAASPAVTKADIIEIFEEMASILEILDQNPFKVRAFINAARALESLTGDLADMVASRDLLEVKGIGKSLFSHIEELLQTGTFGEYEEARSKIPEGLIDMLRIPGMGPKKIKALYENLGVKTIDQLEKAARNNKIAGLEGFGSKSQEKILAGIENVKKYSERHLLSTAMAEADELYAEISKHADVKRSMVGGSLRRIKETVKDIDILVTAEKTERIMDRFTTLPRVVSVVAKGSTKSSIVLKSGINADLRVVSDKEFPYACHYFTGSKEHNTLMRGRAKKMGYKLNEYGLFKGDKPIPCKDEKELFEKLGLDFIPPELREASGEIEAAESHNLPVLINENDIKGLLHVHTTYSDGQATLENMAEGARALGFQYLGIADHSESAAYAGGLTVTELKVQAREIASLNRSLESFRIFHGTESDILVDGSLDYPEDVLELFDFVVASVHSNFGLNEAAMTKRIVRAIENPHTTILGHPTGRLLLSREGYKVDLQAVIEAAEKCNVLIEINANPQRLDLDWRFVRIAKEKGVKIAICPDAHSVKGLEDFRYGVKIARKGWLTKGDVINSLGAEELERFLKLRKTAR